MIETFKASIKPSLALWGVSFLTASHFLQMPIEAWLKFLAMACVIEWVGERGWKRAKELLK